MCVELRQNDEFEFEFELPKFELANDEDDEQVDTRVVIQLADQ